MAVVLRSAECRWTLSAAGALARRATASRTSLILSGFTSTMSTPLRPALLGRQLDAEAGDNGSPAPSGAMLLDGLGHLPSRDARHREIGEDRDRRARRGTVRSPPPPSASTRPRGARPSCKTSPSTAPTCSSSSTTRQRSGHAQRRRLGRDGPFHVGALARRERRGETSGPAPRGCRPSMRAPCRARIPYVIEQPEPGALRSLRGEERIEDLAADGLGNPDARIRHRHARPRCASTVVVRVRVPPRAWRRRAFRMRLVIASRSSAGSPATLGHAGASEVRRRRRRRDCASPRASATG